MNFNYPILGQDGLRLLRPLTIQHNYLSFEMSCFPQKRTPDYTAVSYTWGDGAPTEKIYINGQPFYVRRNLWSCLYYLGQFGNVTWKHLWVDAICIDQSNDKERNAQVRVMDKIYSNACCVSVWLGLPPSAEQYKHLHEPPSTFDDESFEWLDSVQDLANRPYWGRVWVIQEFLLGRDVDIYCGNSRQNWIDFKDLLGYKTGVGDYLQSNFDYSTHSSGLWTAWPLVIGRHPDLHPETPQPLYQLLLNHCNSKCKDSRDRVFALLGLVTIEERRFLERFLPDYTMSEDDVVIIALSHVRQYNLEYDGHDTGRLFSGLGVNCERRRKRLSKRAEAYDYLGELPPSRDFWIDEDETVNRDENYDYLGELPPSRDFWIDGVEAVDGDETDNERTENYGGSLENSRGNFIPGWATWLLGIGKPRE